MSSEKLIEKVLTITDEEKNRYYHNVLKIIKSYDLSYDCEDDIASEIVSELQYFIENKKLELFNNSNTLSNIPKKASFRRVDVGCSDNKDPIEIVNGIGTKSGIIPI